MDEREARRALRWLERQTTPSVVRDGQPPRRRLISLLVGKNEAEAMFVVRVGEVEGPAGA